jgi:hypothetical protein
MPIVKWSIAILVLLNAGYMVFDGVRALVKGSYLTPSSGEYAGQLGPWTNIVQGIGIAPESMLMKCIFVGYGALWLIALALFLMGVRWAPVAMLVLAAGSLWYLWMGTINSLIQIALLLVLILNRPAR